MNYTEHKITLDIQKTVSVVSISVKKGDTGRRLNIHLAESGYPYRISSDCYAVFTARKPDGKVVFNDCSIQDGVIIYDITPQTVAAVGLAECEIILYGADGKQLTSASFNMIVEDTIYDTETEVESADEYNALADLLAKVQRIHADGPVAPAIVCDAKGALIRLTDASNQVLQGLRIFGKSTQDGTPTPANPVEIVNIGAGGSVEAKVMGKNIASKVVYASFSTDYASLVMCNDTGAVKKGKTYTVSVTLTADANTTAYWNSFSKIFGHEVIAVAAGTHRYSKTFTALEDGISGKERILVSKSATGDGVAIKPSDCQIELGAVATDFEITEQSVVIATPNGLPGIPVVSGGNYTDSEGRQWICDEVDLGRGVYVQRIAQYQVSSVRQTTINETTNGIKWAYGVEVKDSALHTYMGKAVNYILNSKFPMVEQASEDMESVGTIMTAYGHANYLEFRFRLMKSEYADKAAVEAAIIGTVIYYLLAEPIERPLADAEIDAYAALHTNKPNTTIYNDAGAYMDAEYVADTKTYVSRNGGGGAGGSSVTIGTVTLLAAAWKGNAAPYSQVVNIAGVTEYSQVDLHPSVEQLTVFHEKDLAFVTENDGGVVTVYAIGDKPQNDYTMQVSITEVNV